MFPLDDTVAVIQSRWLTVNRYAKWPKSKAFPAYRRMLLMGFYLPEFAASYEFTEVFHCSKKNVINFVDTDRILLEPVTAEIREGTHFRW